MPTLAQLHDAAYRRHRDRGQVGWSDEYAYAFARLDDWIGAGPGRLLELGCGAGNLALHLAGRGWTPTGIDFSPTAAWAREQADGKATFVLGDVRALPFADRAFDRVLDGHCWHCVLGADRPRFLAEAFRALRPGGTFTGITMVGPPTGLGAVGYDPATRQTLMDGVPVRYWTTIEEAQNDLARVGFQIVRHEVVPGGETGPDLLWVDARRTA